MVLLTSHNINSSSISSETFFTLSRNITSVDFFLLSPSSLDFASFLKLFFINKKKQKNLEFGRKKQQLEKMGTLIAVETSLEND